MSAPAFCHPDTYADHSLRGQFRRMSWSVVSRELQLHLLVQVRALWRRPLRTTVTVHGTVYSSLLRMQHVKCVVSVDKSSICSR